MPAEDVKILIIDDEESICIGIVNLLSLYNYKADYVNTAEEGIDFLKENPDIDIAILDVNLGTGLSGIEAIPLIKKSSKYIQIIMLTSYDTLETGIECMKKGAFDFMKKPFNEEEFVHKVPVALEKKKLEKLNDIYFHILVHDLKDPLNYMNITLNVLKKEGMSSFNVNNRRMFTIFDFGLKHIERIINNILYIHKFESGAWEKRFQAIALKKEVLHEFQLFLEKTIIQNKRFITEFPDNDYLLKTDKIFFFQVLWNLISNAVRFTPENGIITVIFKPVRDNFLQTSVTNTGSYINQRRAETLFDRYSHSGIQNYTSNQNSGLGLTFSKVAVEFMGGNIWIESREDPPETTFHFTVENKREE